MKLPSYLIKRIPKSENIKRIRALISDNSIHTVCEAAKCPNVGECFSRNTLTFMILGKICTRACKFCGVDKGRPHLIDPKESKKIAAAAKKLKLDYVVVTSVTRDDLPDGGAGIFAQTISELKEAKIKCEVLIPDFQGKIEALKVVLEAEPLVLNHNIETVPRLYATIRPQANYQRSLKLLKSAKRLKPWVYTKSGFMVGLGETDQEVEEVLYDLKSADCDLVTIGQYLPPSDEHAPLLRFVSPETFEGYKKIGESLGFIKVFSGPFVRSSYHASNLIREN